MSFKDIFEGKIADVMIAGGAVIAVIGGLYLAFEYIANNPETFANVPIIGQKARETNAINTYSISNPEYSNAQVDITSSPMSGQQLMTASQQNGNVAVVNTVISNGQTTTGSYVPSYQTTTGETAGQLGTFQNPYLYSNGWQGAGVYLITPSNQVVTFLDYAHYLIQSPE